MPAKSSTIVTALTTAAVVVVGVLGYQAAASAPDSLAPARKGHHDTAKGHEDGSGEKKHRAPAPAPVPAASGTGKRVVYSLAAKRVWLVGANGKALRTYQVAPSTVSPPPGAYAVTSRSVSITGSDGVAIEHVVLFGGVGGVPVGFSAAVDGSRPDPAAKKKTGGIRESRADGKAMWDFALQGTKVVVVA
ncbi:MULTISPECIES: L,D-transpeptidase [unclassified Streptomyces]|uniref:L,D-transpeptidase n=1 Tax=unclassified Streptomyces TaxID=2593676 RepID=UPI0004C64ED8|nr:MULTISPECIES: L,D-transpeptidase [unclassified Streptomyces]